MSSNLSIEQLQSATVIDQDGDKIGDVGQVYVDDATGDPSWVTVRTGLFGTKETFIPLDRAENDANGLRVPYEKKFVKDAPNMDEDEHLSPEQEAELYRYYGLDTGTTTGTDAGREAASGTGTTDRDTTAGTGTAAGTAAGVAAGTAAGDTSRTRGVDEGEYTDVDGDRSRSGLAGEGEYTDVDGDRSRSGLTGEGEYTDVDGDRSRSGLTGEGEYTDVDRDGTRAGLTDTGDTAGTAGYATPGSTGRHDDTTGGADRGTTGVDEDVVGTSSGYSADLRDPETATTGTSTTDASTTDTTSGAAGTGTAAGLAGTGTASGTRDTGVGGDEEIVRHEERLRVGTETRETGRLRLRKHVVTENQTVTVPVEREEVSIEREPIADGEAHTGGTIGEDEERTITVTGQVPVVEKEVVDAERIRVHRDTVHDEEAVSGEVRREEIDVDEDTDTTGTGRTGTGTGTGTTDTDRPGTDRY